MIGFVPPGETTNGLSRLSSICSNQKALGESVLLEPLFGEDRHYPIFDLFRPMASLITC
jgi:hypothetical protein